MSKSTLCFGRVRERRREARRPEVSGKKTEKCMKDSYIWIDSAITQQVGFCAL